MVNIDLPRITYDQENIAYSKDIPRDFSFFSPSQPILHDIGILKQIVVPSKGLIAQLLDQAKQCWLDGAESLTLPGVSQNLPLWSLHFWSALHLQVSPAHVSWQRALTWLQRDDLSPFQDQVRATWEALATVSWSGNLPALSPDRTSQFAPSSLLKFLSRDWLADEQIDMMIHSLEAEVKLSFPNRRIHFVDTILSRTILEVYDANQTGKKVYDPRGTTFLHRFGAELSEKSELAGIFHVNGNHWIGFVIDVSPQDLLYGDPAQQPINSRIISALRWFLSYHIPSLPPNQLDEGVLPCPEQDFSIDSWSCGIYCFNGLAHYFFKQYPLIQNTSFPVAGDLARMATLRK
jgi:hypothetical protein